MKQIYHHLHVNIFGDYICGISIEETPEYFKLSNAATYIHGTGHQKPIKSTNGICIVYKSQILYYFTSDNQVE